MQSIQTISISGRKESVYIAVNAAKHTFEPHSNCCIFRKKREKKMQSQEERKNQSMNEFCETILWAREHEHTAICRSGNSL